LVINRQIVFKKQELEATASDQEADDRSPPVDQGMPAPVLGTDPEIRQTLKSLRTAAWWVVGLLVFIAIRAFWR